MFKFHTFILFSSGTIVGLDFFFLLQIVSRLQYGSYIYYTIYVFFCFFAEGVIFFLLFFFISLLDCIGGIWFFEPGNMLLSGKYFCSCFVYSFEKRNIDHSSAITFHYLVISKRCGEWIQFFIDLLAVRQLFLHWLYWKFESQFDFYLRNKFISEIINSKIWIKFKKKMSAKRSQSLYLRKCVRIKQIELDGRNYKVLNKDPALKSYNCRCFNFNVAKIVCVRNVTLPPSFQTCA